MNTESVKKSRGRPKLLNRDHVLDVAINAYWEEGVDAVSLNALCKKANVSKPALYREFKNEDGLMSAVLGTYEKKVLNPVLRLIAADEPFQKTLDNLVKNITDDSNTERPKGCLFVCMREANRPIGKKTQSQIEQTLDHVLTLFEHWVEHSKNKGEFSENMSSKFAATYIYSQISFAQSQMSREADAENVRAILKTALSVLN